MFEELSDIDLLQLVGNGDEVAFSEIYNRYWEKLFVIASHTISSVQAQEAEEAVHDVFMRLWNGRTSIKINRSLANYLATSVKYEVISRLRKQYRRSKLFELYVVQPEDAENATIDSLREKELFEELEGAISELPERCRIIFKLSRQQGLSADEIARELNISSNTVDAQIGKALKKMRTRFGRLLCWLW